MPKTIRNLLVILILLGVGVFAGFVLFPQKEISLASKTQIVEPEIVPPAKVVHFSEVALTHFKKNPALDASKSVAVDDRFTKVPKDPIIDFKVINGLAVAYGDTVIGKLPEGFDQPTGLTDAHPVHLWKGNEIPYLVDETIKDKIGINQAIELFRARTNIKFIPYADQEDAVVFTLGTENCMSSLGRVGGLQPIYLEPRCGKVEIAHELMHALGFVHEQSRTDRDQYVNILWENIQTAFQSQFAMVPDSLMEAYGDTPFDPSSIMMYDPHIFSTASNVDTMKLKSGGRIENSSSGLSDIDVMRVNRLYRN